MEFNEEALANGQGNRQTGCSSEHREKISNYMPILEYQLPAYQPEILRPEHGCRVSEYMKNGSLEERLLQVNNTLPIPWGERFRIVLEVASGLSFLHNSMAKQIVHRDIKSSNILLDYNFVSKIGDFGLSTMVHSDPFSVSTIYKDTGSLEERLFQVNNTPPIPWLERYRIKREAASALPFLHNSKPEKIIHRDLKSQNILLYHNFVSVTVDFHLSKKVNFVEILDSKAGRWQTDETQELTKMGLNCAEIWCRDSPDLKDQLLPALERLKRVTDSAQNLVSNVQAAPPNLSIYPILKPGKCSLPWSSSFSKLDLDIMDLFLLQGNIDLKTEKSTNKEGSSPAVYVYKQTVGGDGEIIIQIEREQQQSSHKQNSRPMETKNRAAPRSARYVLLLIATLIATVSFQRGIFQNENQSSDLIHLYILSNSVVFFSSIAMMIILMDELPLRLWLLISVFSMILTYMFLIAAVSPGETMTVSFLGLPFALVAAFLKYTPLQKKLLNYL